MRSPPDGAVANNTEPGRLTIWFNVPISVLLTGFHLRFDSGSLMVLLFAGVSACFTLCRLHFNSLYRAMVPHAGCNLAMIAAIFFRYAG